MANRKIPATELLLANDFAGLGQLLAACLSTASPGTGYRNNPIAQLRGLLCQCFYAYFASLGLDLTLEESS
jgi:hypothetical protein